MEDLDRNGPASQAISGAKHLAHTARSDEPLDLEAVPDHLSHGRPEYPRCPWSSFAVSLTLGSMAAARRKPISKTEKKKSAAKTKAKKTAAAETKAKKAAPKKTTTKRTAKVRNVGKKKVAAKAKPKAAAKAKPKAAAKAKPKAAAKAKPKAAAKAKPKATKATAKRRSAIGPVSSKRVPPPRPSERAIAVAAQLPKERALTDEEREAMTKVAQTALSLLQEGMQSASNEAESIVRKIGDYVDAVRSGSRPEPRTQDERLGIGVLWGEQVRAQVGWRWVHLSYPDGFASYALVPDDRAFACFPLNRLAELIKPASPIANTSVPLFDSIRAGTLPQRRENAYLVIG